MSSSARPDAGKRDQLRKPDVPRPPAAARRDEDHDGDYTRHELGRLLGNRGLAARARLRAAMRAQLVADWESGADAVVEVILLNDQVLWDWDRFTIAGT